MLLLILLLLASPVSAASLVWDATADGQLDVEVWDTANLKWSFVMRVPANPPKFPLVTGKFGDYRVTAPGGASSNTARYSADIETGLTDQVKALDLRVTALEKPVSVNNMTTKQIDADHIEVIGQACTSLKTTGTGLKRIVECVH
jgi:hypothetical protein